MCNNDKNDACYSLSITVLVLLPASEKVYYDNPVQVYGLSTDGQ